MDDVSCCARARFDGSGSRGPRRDPRKSAGNPRGPFAVCAPRRHAPAHHQLPPPPPSLFINPARSARLLHHNSSRKAEHGRESRAPPASRPILCLPNKQQLVRWLSSLSPSPPPPAPWRRWRGQGGRARRRWRRDLVGARPRHGPLPPRQLGRRRRPRRPPRRAPGPLLRPGLNGPGSLTPLRLVVS